MKILFLSNLYPPNVVGGYERLCFEMAEALAARGHEVTVLSSDYGSGREKYPDQCIHRKLKLFTDDEHIHRPAELSEAEQQTRSADNIATLRRVVEESAPDRIFVWNLYFLDKAFMEAIEELAQPAVYLVTDNWLITFYNQPFMPDYFIERVWEAPSSDWSIRTKLWMKQFVARLKRPRYPVTGHAIFASRFMVDLYREAGIRFQSSSLIYHGVHLAPPTERVRRDRLLRDGELSLLFAGRLGEVKGVHIAIRALPSIVRALPHLKVHLSIVGDPQDDAYLRRIREEAASIDCEDAVSFRPAVPANQLSKLFDEHDIYLFPSLYEPFSLTLILALYAGIPTVASDAGGNTEIAEHRHTAMLFPKNDAEALSAQVVALIGDPELRAVIAERAVERASHHNFKKMVADVEKALELER